MLTIKLQNKISWGVKFIFLLLIFGASGCLQKYKLEDEHHLPISKTYFFDYEVIGKNCRLQNSKNFYGYSNWLTATNIIDRWKELFSENIGTPMLALKKADNVDIQHFADDTWVREYNILFDTNSYNMELYSTSEADSTVFWEMFKITDEAALMLLQGRADKLKNHGNWFFYKYVFKPIEVLEIDWRIENSDLEVTYINLYKKSKFCGNILKINYDFDNAKLLKISTVEYAYYDTTQIEFDFLTNTGKIKNEHIFADSLWHTWKCDSLVL